MKNAIYNKLIRHNDSHLQLHLRYFQDLLNNKIEQAKRKYFEYIYLISYPTKTSTLKSTRHS